MRSSLLGVQLESEVPVPRLWQGNLFGREFVLNKIISWGVVLNHTLVNSGQHGE